MGPTQFCLANINFDLKFVMNVMKRHCLFKIVFFLNYFFLTP
jgi:hypothetical protein